MHPTLLYTLNLPIATGFSLGRLLVRPHRLRHPRALRVPAPLRSFYQSPAHKLHRNVADTDRRVPRQKEQLLLSRASGVSYEKVWFCLPPLTVFVLKSRSSLNYIYRFFRRAPP